MNSMHFINSKTHEYHSDILIVGGGVLGLSAALYAAKMGKTVRVLEKFTFGNQEGSSAGHVRMWRTAITEPSHVKMAFIAGDMYRELENEANCKLLYMNGVLNLGVETSYTAQGTIETAYQVLKELGHQCVKYNKKQLEERFPFKNLPENYYGIFHKNNATIDVKFFIKTLTDLNRRYGVFMYEKESVLKIRSEANGVEVTTEKGR